MSWDFHSHFFYRETTVFHSTDWHAKVFLGFVEVFYWTSKNSAVRIDILKYFLFCRCILSNVQKFPSTDWYAEVFFWFCGGGILSNVPKFHSTDWYAEVFFGFAEEVFYRTSQNSAVLIDMLKYFSVLQRYSIERPKIHNPQREKNNFLLTTFFKSLIS